MLQSKHSPPTTSNQYYHLATGKPVSRSIDGFLQRKTELHNTSTFKGLLNGKKSASSGSLSCTRSLPEGNIRFGKLSPENNGVLPPEAILGPSKATGDNNKVLSNNSKEELPKHDSITDVASIKTTETPSTPSNTNAPPQESSKADPNISPAQESSVDRKNLKGSEVPPSKQDRRRILSSLIKNYTASMVTSRIEGEVLEKLKQEDEPEKILLRIQGTLNYNCFDELKGKGVTFQKCCFVLEMILDNLIADKNISEDTMLDFLLRLMDYTEKGIELLIIALND